MECGVCCGVSKNWHKCVKCEFTVCRSCARYMATTCDITDCPQCKQPYSNESRNKLYGVTFVAVNLRKIHRERLYKRQSFLFADTLPTVHAEQKRRHLRKELKRINALINSGNYELMSERQVIQRALRSVRLTSARAGPMNCSYVGCQGYLGATGECNSCNRMTCLQCGCSHIGDHNCNPSVLANLVFINNDCRPCVRCFAPCLRTEGCSVMWCPNCHTFWNWDTMQVIQRRGFVPHNPDHRHWLTQGGTELRELEDIPCGGLPTGDDLHFAVVRELEKNVNTAPFAEYIINAAAGTYEAQRIRNLYPLIWDEVELTAHSRLSFLIGDTTREQFSRNILRIVRRAEYKKKVGEVICTLVFCAADILQMFCSNGFSCRETADSLRELRDVINEALSLISKEWNRRVPFLDILWTWQVPSRSI